MYSSRLRNTIQARPSYPLQQGSPGWMKTEPGGASAPTTCQARIPQLRGAGPGPRLRKGRGHGPVFRGRPHQQPASRRVRGLRGLQREASPGPGSPSPPSGERRQCTGPCASRGCIPRWPRPAGSPAIPPGGCPPRPPLLLLRLPTGPIEKPPEKREMSPGSNTAGSPVAVAVPHPRNALMPGGACRTPGLSRASSPGDHPLFGRGPMDALCRHNNQVEPRGI
jgi:hypothetical protein